MQLACLCHWNSLRRTRQGTWRRRWTCLRGLNGGLVLPNARHIDNIKRTVVVGEVTTCLCKDIWLAPRRHITLSGKLTLGHEAGDDTVEGGALVGQVAALLAGAQGAEVLRGLGHGVGVCISRRSVFQPQFRSFSRHVQSSKTMRPMGWPLMSMSKNTR